VNFQLQNCIYCLSWLGINDKGNIPLPASDTIQFFKFYELVLSILLSGQILKIETISSLFTLVSRCSSRLV